MEKKVLTPSFDIESLNIVKDCEQIFTFPFLNANGDETGITVSVVGKHCNMVKNHIDRLLNKRRQADKLAERAGKHKARPVQEDEQLGLEMVAVRVVSWTGIAQECSFENVMRLCEINPLFVEQVSLHSEELSNFTQSK